MIYPASANWNPSAEGHARADTRAPFDRGVTAMHNSMSVSASQPLALAEQQRGDEMVAFTTQTSHSQTQAGAASAQSLYSPDTVVMALALVGAWMMLVGGAMLSRSMRFFKVQNTPPSAAEHQ